jgi:uncharacterized protein YggE
MSAVGITFGQAEGNYAKSQGNALYGNYNTPYNSPSFSTIQLNDSTFTLQSKVLYNIKPDKLVAIFSVTQTGKELKECNTNLNAKLESFRGKIGNLGISKENIHTDILYCIPKFEMSVEKKMFSKTATEVPVGYEMQKNIHVTFDNEEQLEGILNAALESEIYDFVKVEYFIADKWKWQKAAMLKAAQILDIKADTLFKYFNVNNKTRNVVHEEVQMITPPQKYRSYTAYESYNPYYKGGVKPKNTTYAEKNQTQFYDAVKQSEFDYIENPVENKPVVSMIYRIVVKFTIPKENNRSNTANTKP